MAGAINHTDLNICFLAKRCQGFLTDDDVIVNTHANDEDEEAKKLQSVESLPAHGQGNSPDDLLTLSDYFSH